MLYLTPAEIISHLKTEIIDEVAGDNATALQDAVSAAISEMRGYISFYDVAAILATTGNAREPILLLYTKDIAVWHFIQLSNANIDIEFRETRYKLAIAWLRDVQKGICVPNLPVITNADPLVQTGKVKYGSNLKRQTSY